MAVFGFGEKSLSANGDFSVKCCLSEETFTLGGGQRCFYSGQKVEKVRRPRSLLNNIAVRPDDNILHHFVAHCSQGHGFGRASWLFCSDAT